MKRIFAFAILTFCVLAFPVGAQSVLPAKGVKKIALTFDACMTTSMLKQLNAGVYKSLYNEAIITFLKQEKIAATFFITGLWAEKYPQAVREIAHEPFFEIGNHSYSHKAFVEDCFSLPFLSENEKMADLLKSQEVLTRLTGKKPKLFRFPGGCKTASDQDLVHTLGLKVIGWNFASGDAFNGNTDAIVQNVLSKAKDGVIVVFHLAGEKYAPRSEEALKRIVPELRKSGFDFVTISDLTSYNPAKIKSL